MHKAKTSRCENFRTNCIMMASLSTSLLIMLQVTFEENKIMDRLLHRTNSSSCKHKLQESLRLLSDDQRKHAINKKPIKNVLHQTASNKSSAYQNTSYHKRIMQFARTCEFE